jgi:hypothetical protein
MDRRSEARRRIVSKLPCKRIDLICFPVAQEARTALTDIAEATSVE